MSALNRMAALTAALCLAATACTSSTATPSAGATPSPAETASPAASPTTKPPPTASPTPVHGEYLLYMVDVPRAEGSIRIPNNEIWIVRPDGTGRRKIAMGLEASWSHDGRYVHVVSIDDHSGASCVRKLSDVPVDGGPAVPISTPSLVNGDTSFAWSPDDTQIVYQHQDGGVPCESQGGYFWGPPGPSGDERRRHEHAHPAGSHALLRTQVVGSRRHSPHHHRRREAGRWNQPPWSSPANQHR